MSIEPESNAMEVRTEDGRIDGSLRKVPTNANVVDTKITLFNTGARNKAPLAKSMVQRYNPLQPRS